MPYLSIGNNTPVRLVPAQGISDEGSVVGEEVGGLFL